MKILSYKYSDINEKSWEYSKAEFSNLNLVVGVTGAGKSKYFNTFFSLANIIKRREKENHKNGIWEIKFQSNKKIYRWNFKFMSKVIEEKLVKINGNQEEIIIDRQKNHFVFCDKKMPKLTDEETALYLLKEENEIKHIYEGINFLYRRYGVDNVSVVKNISVVNRNFVESMDKKKSIQTYFNELLAPNVDLNASLLIIKEHSPLVFSNIIDRFKEVFPNIVKDNIKGIDIKMANINSIPVLHFKERNVVQEIPIYDLSSGMLKVLEIIRDVNIAPEDSIFLIDEYENSLGINALDFLPDLIMETNKIQFFITSHHPYIINKIPIENWYVLRRNGSKVSIEYGESLKSYLGSSRQDAFIILVNSSFFNED